MRRVLFAVLILATLASRSDAMWGHRGNAVSLYAPTEADEKEYE